MSIRAWLLGLAALLATVLAVASVLVTVTFNQFEDQRNTIRDRLLPESTLSRGLLVSLVDQETGERGFVITGDPAFLAPYRSGGRDFTRQVAALSALATPDATVRAALQRVVASADYWQRNAAVPEIAARRATGGAATDDGLIRAGNGKAAFDRVRVAAAELQAVVEGEVAAAQEEATDLLDVFRWTLLGAALGVGATSVLALWVVHRRLLRPILAVRESMRLVAGGDLEHRIESVGPREVAGIGRDAEAMRRRIADELEASVEATEAVAQSGPAVLGLRAELAPSAHHDLDGLEVSGALSSAEGLLAGDWWEAVRRPNGSIALVLADVSGHGAQAGLVAVRFKQRLAALLDTSLDLEELFAVAARSRDSADDERFLSCLVVEVEPRSGWLRWVNAGHPGALVVSRRQTQPRSEGRAPKQREGQRDGQRERHEGAEDARRQLAQASRELEPTGPIVSALTGGWSVGESWLAPDDLLVACTDGVFEARNAAGEEFGVGGLLDTLTRMDRWTPADAVSECVDAVRRFAVDSRRDDVTCVALSLGRQRREGPAVPEGLVTNAT